MFVTALYAFPYIFVSVTDALDLLSSEMEEAANISEFDEKRATPEAIAEYDAVGEHASQLL